MQEEIEDEIIPRFVDDIEQDIKITMTQDQTRAQHELDELDLWFKDNKSSQGSDEWNIKIDRGIDLTEIMNDL